MRKDGGVVLVAVAWMAVACSAQSMPASNPVPKPDNGPAPCSVAPQPVPCGATSTVTGKPSTAEQFPFPGEDSGSSVPLTQGPAAANASGIPQTPNATGASSGTAAGADKTEAAFPFPGEDDKSAGATGGPGGNGATNSSAGASAGSSSSSSSGEASDAGDATAAGGTPDGSGLVDKGSEGTSGRHLLHRVNPIGTKLQSADEREAEDLSVAKFYNDKGDLQGAYLRSQDAVKIAPDDPDAHFALAEAAAEAEQAERSDCGIQGVPEARPGR